MTNRRWDHRFSLAVAVLLLAHVGTALFADSPQSSVATGHRAMPTTLEGSGPSVPLFIAADTLIDDSGNLDLSALGTDASLAMDSVLGHPSAKKECLDYWTSYEDVDDEPRTLASALHKAPNVLIGTVTGRQPGFLDLIVPGTLLRVQVDEILRGLYMEEIFTFSPMGNFKVGEIDVCKKSKLYPELPILGDQVVLLFDRTGPRNVVLLGGDGILTLKQDDTVSLSQVFTKKESNLETITSWGLLSVLRSTLSAEAGK